jgi:hypothetical protein
MNHAAKELLVAHGYLSYTCTVKKVSDIPVPMQPGCRLPNSSWAGIIRFFPPRESLVGDIPDGDGSVANLFYSLLDDRGKGSTPFFADHQLCAWHLLLQARP